jgi:hypothetical protein
MRYSWCSVILFSFPSFPEFHSSIGTELFHCYKHVLHLSLYMIMLAFVCMFIFWICLPCIREHMQPLSFWVCLPSLLTWYPPIAFIYIQTPCHYSLWLSKTPSYICTIFSWSIHQL